MMLSVDEVQKMKVVELRAELTSRNLDVRGVKAVLVERLLDALMTESSTGENSTPASGQTGPAVIEAQEVEKNAEPVAATPEPVVQSRSTRSSLNDTPVLTTSPTKPVQPTATPTTPQKVLAPVSPQKVPPAAPIISPQKVATAAPVSPQKPPVAAPVSPQKPVVAAPASPQKPPVAAPVSPQKPPVAAPVSSQKPPVAAPVSPQKPPIAAPVSPQKPPIAAPVSPQKPPVALTKAATPPAAVQPRAASPAKPAATASPTLASGATVAQQATLPQKVEALSPSKPAEAVQDKSNEVEVDEAEVPATGETSVQSEPSQAETTGDTEAMDTEEGREDKKRKLEALNGSQAEPTEGRKTKKFKLEERKPRIVAENEPDFDGKGVVLDWYKSDLNLRISETDFLKAEQIVFEEFPWAYAGAKATHGFNGGKVCFEVKWVGSKDIKADLGNNAAKHVVRVGWSDLFSDLQLGEDKFSYAYDSSGKFYTGTDNEPKDGGEAFAKDDVIVSYLNFESDPVEIQFSKNGTVVGSPIQIPKADLEGKVLFPHVLVRNACFEANFGGSEPAHTLLENYEMTGKVEEDAAYRVRGPQRAETKGDCEFIMLCGMACSGKTKWAKDKKLNHPDQHFNILGTSTVVERVVKDITVAGLLMKAGKFVEKLVDIAPSRRRNYVLDQSNVLPSVQRRKAGGFDGFKRRAVVILPSDEEYQNRIKSREAEQGKSVPKSTVLDMKAGFRLPEAGELFNEVEFPELGKTEAEELVGTYNKEGLAAGYGQRPLTVRGGGPRPSSRGMRGGPRGGPRGGFFRGDPRGGRGGWRGPMRGGPPPFRGGPPPRGFRGGRFPGGMAIPSIDRVSRDPNRGFGRGGGAPRGIPSLGGIRRGNGGGGPLRGAPRGGRGGSSWGGNSNGAPARSLFPRGGRGGPINRGGGARGGAPGYNNGSAWAGSPPAGGYGQGRFGGSPAGGFGQNRFGGAQGNPSNRGGQGGGFQNQNWGQGGGQIWDRGNTGNSGVRLRMYDAHRTKADPSSTQGFENFGGSTGGSMGNQFAADPWSAQQVPDQGYGQSWDNTGAVNMGGGAGRGGGGGGGGGTWQGYGGQTYGNYNPGGYGRK